MSQMYIHWQSAAVYMAAILVIATIAVLYYSEPSYPVDPFDNCMVNAAKEAPASVPVSVACPGF